MGQLKCPASTGQKFVQTISSRRLNAREDNSFVDVIMPEGLLQDVFNINMISRTALENVTTDNGVCLAV
jgi:hypothetical protein